MQNLAKLLFTLMAIILLSSCSKVEQPLSVDQVFTDHMVVQANQPIRVWGKASSGEKISVSIRNQTETVIADENGNWLINLKPESYGEATKLTVKTAKEQIVYNDVLLGEVWLCSGQSNMEMPLVSNWATVNNFAEEVIDAQNYPNIRLFTIAKNTSFQPIDTIITEGWKVCDSIAIKDFSATAYFFGRKLYQDLKVPIGLVHSSWGGTNAESWTSKNSLLNYSDFAERTLKISKLTASRDSLEKKYKTDLAKMLIEVQKADIGLEGETALFAKVEVDDADWMPIDLPKMWEETALGVFDGSGWFRKTVNISKQMASQELTLCFGAVDDYDEAWVNGVKVGETKQWGVLREYKIPEGVVKPGKNQITIRVYDYGGGGGFMNEAKDFRIDAANGQSIAIAKGWVVKKGFDFKDIETIPVPLSDPNQPTVLYNAMINPILNLSFNGVIWYQGENNAGRAYQYRKLFSTLIKDWRSNFSNDDFPFYFVQLASYLPRNDRPVEDTWAELREAQTMALDLPNTGMAVAIDIGNALDIHPGNKQEVGRRLALNALAKTYKKNIEHMGPLYKDYTVKNNTIEITFDYNEGLASSDGKKLKGFAIAGKDKKFVWADAVIKNDKVLVSSPLVKNPVAVRYAWSSNPACNLINKSGLPASPFRTDDFKGITED